MDPHTREQLIFEANRKSTGASYLLWFFLGGFGAHRFYLGRNGTAITQLLLLLLGWIPFAIGWVALGIWLLVDLFLIPGMVREENIKTIHRMGGSAGAANGYQQQQPPPQQQNRRLDAPPPEISQPRRSLDPRVEEIRAMRRR